MTDAEQARLAQQLLERLVGCGDGHKWEKVKPDHMWVWKARTCPEAHYTTQRYWGSMFTHRHIGKLCARCGMGQCVYCNTEGYFGDVHPNSGDPKPERESDDQTEEA